MLTLWARLGRMLVSWTLLMTLAGAAVYGLALAPAAFVEEISFAGLMVSLSLASMLVGLLAGYVQRIYLRPYWHFSSGWAWASMTGWGIGIPLVVILSATLRELISGWPDGARLLVFLVSAALCGVLSSLGQWVWLRRVSKRHPWWLFANAVGWLMAWILVLAFGLFIGGGERLPATPDRAVDAMILGGLAGSVIGFEQGIAVMGLFAQQAWERTRKNT